MNNVQAHCPQGEKLPEDWTLNAPLRARQASRDYLERLQNAWRGPLLRTNDSDLMQARLRPTSDSRADALRLVADGDDEQVWQEAGVTVRIKKRT